jgi:hypothetical protein
LCALHQRRRFLPRFRVIDQCRYKRSAFGAAEPHDPLEEVDWILIDIGTVTRQRDQVANVLFRHASGQRDGGTLACSLV